MWLKDLTQGIDPSLRLCANSCRSPRPTIYFLTKRGYIDAAGITDAGRAALDELERREANTPRARRCNEARMIRSRQ